MDFDKLHKLVFGPHIPQMRRLSPQQQERAMARIKKTPLYQEYLKDRMSIDPQRRRFFDIIGRDFPMPKDDEAFRLFLEAD